MQAGLRTERPDSLKRYQNQAPDSLERSEIIKILEAGKE